MISIARSIFHVNTPEEILKKNLYEYRNKAKDDEFHFLIGISMLQLGFIYEATIAFRKALSLKASQKSRLFLCIALLHAERYEECCAEMKFIDWAELDSSQLFMYLDIMTRLQENTNNITRYFEEKYKNASTLKDRIVMALYQISKKEPIDITEFNKGEFFSDADYLMFIDDCHTLGYTELKDILLNFPITKINVDSAIRTLTGTNTLKNATQEEIEKWLNNIQIPEKELGIWSKIYAAVHEANANEKLLDKMTEFYEKGAREKSAMLAIAIHILQNIQKEDAPKLKKIFDELIDIDDENILFRKKYHEFLLQCNDIAGARKIDKDTLDIRLRKEKEIADLIEAFHRFYGSEPCPLEGEGKCPLCFGSQERPILKAICTNVMPCEIFARNYVSQTITISDEETLHKIIDWQPMHVASPIIGEYLKSQGAYHSRRDFPDILIEGETYLFFKLTQEAFERLIEAGYSIGQIEPMFSVMYPTKKPPLVAKASHEDKETDYKNLVSAKDFTIEIVRAIAPEEKKQG